MSKYCFEKDLELSKKYERKFGEWLRKLGIPNVSYAPDGLFEDYDVKTFDLTYEIKYDRWMATTGNFCLETYSCKENNSLGWFFKTKADFIVVFYNETEFVGISRKDLQDAWFDHPEIWKQVKIQQEWGTTICWLADCKKIPGIKMGSITDVN